MANLVVAIAQSDPQPPPNQLQRHVEHMHWGPCMRAIQLTTGSESNGEQRQPLVFGPAAASGQAIGGLIISTLNEARGLRGDLVAPARAGVIVSGLAFIATGLFKIRWTRPAGPPQRVGSTLKILVRSTRKNPVTDTFSEPGGSPAQVVESGGLRASGTFCVDDRSG